VNPRKPTALKALSGTLRPSRPEPAGVAAPTVTDVPDAPNWLPNAHAVNEWNRLAPLLTNLGMLTETGLGPLAMLCSLHGTIVQQLAAGTMPNAALYAQYQTYTKEFGLTPASSTKVTPRSQKKANKFDGLR